MTFPINVVYFGSFHHYSAIILKSLIQDPDITVSAVITTPLSAIGRQKILTKKPNRESPNLPIPQLLPY